MDAVMRVTAQVKTATRCRILDAARNLFAGQGFDASTTRDIARCAGIATGTLFNYFPSKEHVAMALIGSGLEAAHADFAARTIESHTPGERLFALVACELRHLRPCRSYVRPVLDLSTGPDAAPDNGDVPSLRAMHQAVAEPLLAELNPDEPLSPVAVQLYWTLYTGVLIAWSRDDSPHQEDTLALLDQSLRMFVTWYQTPTTPVGNGLRAVP
jgi:AcrR family transcriptional regulator